MLDAAPLRSEAVLAFEDVYRLHAAGVYRFCLSQLRDAALAEDVAAEVFTSAFAAYGRSRPAMSELRPWLYRIARNAAVDVHRRRARQIRLLGRLRGGGAIAADAEAHAVLRDDLRRVCDAVAGLGRRDRQLVGLRVAGGLPFGEVAAVLGISEHAAKVATHRALARVRAAVEERQG